MSTPDATPSRSGPLAGLRVLDLSRVLAGPYCAMQLGDLGAEVIKVEQPGVGDETRRWGPPYAADGASAYYLSINRNKRGIAVDMKTETGRAIIRELAARSDVVLENFRQGLLDEMGLGYDELSREHPGLVWCSISGYGPVGPQREQPGFDFVAQAETGVMSITGQAAGDPYKVGVAIVDITTGMYATTAILAALHHREATGQGQRIDCSLFASGLAWLANVAQNYLVAGEDSLRLGNAHRSIVPYETFQARDRQFALGVGTDRQFAALCAVLGVPEWASDPRYATNPARVQHRMALVAALNERFATRDAAHWLADLRAASVPCGAIQTVGEALHSEQAQALGSVVSIPYPPLGALEVIAPPYLLHATPATVRLPPPRLGEHTDAVLHEVLGYTAEMMTHLRSQRIVA
jgi:crotonobetainyl-CoA:carnitine CoA-transferase CaiB-like acyl-CoA transferase